MDENPSDSPPDDAPDDTPAPDEIPSPSDQDPDPSSEIELHDLPDNSGLRLIGAAEGEEDRVDRSLRPSRLDEFVGQAAVKEARHIAISAAQERREPLDHALFYGPPGLGKTTLARIISAEMGVSLRTTSGPALARAGDLAAILNSLQEHDVLFIDSSHTVRIGGDVVHEICEILPRLKQGVAVHFHDIFLPSHYPREWVMERNCFWAEQYLLQAFLAHNDAWRVIWSGAVIHLHAPEADLAA